MASSQVSHPLPSSSDVPYSLLGDLSAGRFSADPPQSSNSVSDPFDVDMFEQEWAGIQENMEYPLVAQRDDPLQGLATQLHALVNIPEEDSGDDSDAPLAERDFPDEEEIESAPPPGTLYLLNICLYVYVYIYKLLFLQLSLLPVTRKDEIKTKTWRINGDRGPASRSALIIVADSQPTLTVFV